LAILSSPAYKQEGESIMPTFNELVKGFADKQTYEGIQGAVHAGLKDIHNIAVRLSALQSKPNLEGLVQLAFPLLIAEVTKREAFEPSREEEENRNEENRKKAATGPEHRDAPSENPEGIPQGGMWGVRYPYSQKYRSGLSCRSTSPATKALHAAFEADECDRGGKSLEAQSSND
jgi:hypothetical protein